MTTNKELLKIAKKMIKETQEFILERIKIEPDIESGYVPIQTFLIYVTETIFINVLLESGLTVQDKTPKEFIEIKLNSIRKKLFSYLDKNEMTK